MHDEVNYSNKGKFLNIEVLRIIGCISIVFIHLFPQYLYDIFKDIELYGKLASCTGNGNKAVDMFFMISGFLFSLKLNLDRPITEFLLKKFIRLWPTLVFVILVSFLISIIGIFDFNFYDDLLAILGLSGTGLVLRIAESASVFWYVSAMIWTMLLFMYLLKNYQLKTVNLIIAALIFFSYSFIIHATEGEIRGHTNTYCYVFNLGMLRALGGIGIGYFIGEWYKAHSEKIRKLHVSFVKKLLVTLVESLCLSFTIYNLILHKFKFNNQIIYIIVFTFILTFFVIKKGFLSEFLDKKVFSKISKYTYSIYMTHLLILETLKGSLWKNYQPFVYEHPILNITVTLILIAILGIFTYHVIEVPSAKFLRRKFLKST